MCCAEALVKILLYLFNLAFFLCGAVLFSVGIYLVVTDEGISIIDDLALPSAEGAGDIWSVAVYLIIAIGAFIFLVGFIGCTGVKSKNKCLVFFFVSLLLICLVAEITAAILAVVYKNKIDEEVGNEMRMEIRERYILENATNVSSGDQISYSWNYLQHKWQCCGSSGHVNYWNSRFHNATNQKVPYSCCVMKDGASGSLKKEDVKDLDKCMEMSNNELLYTEQTEFLHWQGCYDLLKEWIENHSLIIMAAGFSFAAIQVLGILLGCCLTNLWGKDA